MRLPQTLMPATGKDGKSFIKVDTSWTNERGGNSKGVMGSNHLRLVIALDTEVYRDHQLVMGAKKTLDALFTDMDLHTDVLGKTVRMMKWHTFPGSNDGALELTFALGARDVDTIMARLLTQNGGRESHGAAPRGPAIRKIYDISTDVWRTTMRADKESHTEHNQHGHTVDVDGELVDGGGAHGVVLRVHRGTCAT